jgi:hypothetical protein
LLVPSIEGGITTGRLLFQGISFLFDDFKQPSDAVAFTPDDGAKFGA